ncbi:MAG: exodeoxyribonuclease III [Desulfosoma sp.]|uniref:exodeoxyribonuclease III n=1 Tax=Desulfosoma sp. TaxID=2603217 RepID=UPI004049B271
MLWKAATFNVNGVRARLDQLMAWISQQHPHVLCLQETKCQEAVFPRQALEALGYEVLIKGEKSFNGVAVLTRKTPKSVIMKTGDAVVDGEARFLAAQVHGIWVVNTYVPQGRAPDDPAFRYKLDFLDRVGRWIQERFSPQDPLVWTGDLNVAPEAMDVYDPKRLEGEVGFHPEERAKLKDIMAWGLVDLFRRMHPQVKQFTFWDYRLPKSFDRNLGWRLDHMLVTEPMAHRCVECFVDPGPRAQSKPSDHTPLVAVFDLSSLPGET